MELTPPEINPKLKDVPIRKPIGSDTVLLTKKFKLYFLFKFCEPRQRKNINNTAVAIFRVKIFNFKNIFEINFDQNQISN
tara:strand:+ start:1219 stop:1458 length:240 start_codon:yes stop_codon:yes gene_type:complete